MRYTIKPEVSSVLTWLRKNGSGARVIPTFPSKRYGLVVAHLVAGKVVAEVIPNRAAFPAACGSRVPLGRLYFHVPKARLYEVCSDLTAAVFNDKDK